MGETRWLQRLENFERAYGLLRDGLAPRPAADLSDLEKEGIIQRFEYTFELAWKTLKDYLQYGGAVLEPVTPRAVIKAAFAAGILADGQVWIDMLDHRNVMSHTYDRDNFENAFNAIVNRYLTAIEDLYLFLKRKSADS